MPRIVARIPAMIRGSLVSVGQREAADSRRDQERSDDRRVVCGPRSGRARREGERDGDAGDHSPRPPGGGGRAEDCDERRPVASRVHGRLSGSMRWPAAGSIVGAIASQSARPTIAPISAAIAPTTVPFVNSTRRRCFSVAPIAGERAELAEPSLRDDCEACGRNQRGQEQEDGRHGEHRQRVRRLVVGPSLGARERGPVPRPRGLRSREGVDRAGARVDQAP